MLLQLLYLVVLLLNDIFLIINPVLQLTDLPLLLLLELIHRLELLLQLIFEFIVGAVQLIDLVLQLVNNAFQFAILVLHLVYGVVLLLFHIVHGLCLLVELLLETIRIVIQLLDVALHLLDDVLQPGNFLVKILYLFTLFMVLMFQILLEALELFYLINHVKLNLFGFIQLFLELDNLIIETIVILLQVVAGLSVMLAVGIEPSDVVF